MALFFALFWAELVYGLARAKAGSLESTLDASAYVPLPRFVRHGLIVARDAAWDASEMQAAHVDGVQAAYASIYPLPKRGSR